MGFFGQAGGMKVKNFYLRLFLQDKSRGSSLKHCGSIVQMLLFFDKHKKGKIY